MNQRKLWKGKWTRILWLVFYWFCYTSNCEMGKFPMIICLWLGCRMVLIKEGKQGQRGKSSFQQTCWIWQTGRQKPHLVEYNSPGICTWGGTTLVDLMGCFRRCSGQGRPQAHHSLHRPPWVVGLVPQPNESIEGKVIIVQAVVVDCGNHL